MAVECKRGCVVKPGATNVSVLGEMLAAALANKPDAFIPPMPEKKYKCSCDWMAPLYESSSDGLVGSKCMRENAGLTKSDRFDAELCGEICSKGQEHYCVHCPAGFKPSCEGGCKPPSSLKALEAALADIIYKLPQHLQEPSLWQEFYRTCGCDSRVVPYKVKYGHDFGYACRLLSERAKPKYDEALCGPKCRDADENAILHFCPHGFKASCAGCTDFGSSARRLEL